MNQIVEYVQKNKELPEYIELPPEEFIFINYLFNIEELENKRIENFLGFPLKINYEEQNITFLF